MSGGRSCRCGRVSYRVTVYRANFSTFNGRHWTPSDYSEVRCICCGSVWRSKAAYIDELPRIEKSQSWDNSSEWQKCEHGRNQ